MTKIDKWSILAGVRFFLASLVAFNHLYDYVPGPWMKRISDIGSFEAILGFLLISGYSISCSYARQPQGFIGRRLHRLYPVYLTAIAVSFAVEILIKHPAPNLVFVLLNALFLNQLVTSVSFVGPAWSLALELWLYCLTPVLMVLSKRRLRLIIFGSFTCFLAYTFLRSAAHFPYFSGVGYGANLILLSFIWVAGLRLAVAKNDRSALRDIGLIFWGHIALAVMIQYVSRVRHHELSNFWLHDILYFVLQSALLAGLYLVFKHFVIPERSDVHRSRILRWLGDISYPLYLLHAAIYALLTYWGFKSPIPLYLIAVLFSALVSWLVDFYARHRHQQVGTN